MIFAFFFLALLAPSPWIPLQPVECRSSSSCRPNPLRPVSSHRQLTNSCSPSSLSRSKIQKGITYEDNDNISNGILQESFSTRGGSNVPVALHRIDVFQKLRVALAGGIAGATGTALLYPIDTAKTLRQADPVRYTSVRMALKDLIRGVAGEGRSMGITQAYSGVITATLFSVPSSALYFGAYETSKQFLANKVNEMNYRRNAMRDNNNDNINTIPSTKQRFFIHAFSAFSGNACSSLIFVPKEFIKQQMQAYGSGAMSAAAMASAAGTSRGIGGQQHWLLKNKNLFDANAAKLMSVRTIVRDAVQEKGIAGLYCGYKSTLMRNVPSAIMRFAIYEELKLRFLNGDGDDAAAYAGGGTSPVFFLSGALAGAMSSGLMTPMDVIKTKISTGTMPNNLGLINSVQWIVQKHGLQGLYAGARARMVWSGAFSAIGFGTFEAAKKFLDVNEEQH